MSKQQQSQCSSSSSASANAPVAAGLQPPAELLNEIVQALPISRCLDTDSIKSYMVTPLRHFVRQRYDTAKKLMQDYQDKKQRLLEKGKELTSLHDELIQIIQFINQQLQLLEQNGQNAVEIPDELDYTPRLRAIGPEVNGVKAELEEMEKKVAEFARAWKRSKENGGFGEDEKMFGNDEDEEEMEEGE